VKLGIFLCLVGLLSNLSHASADELYASETAIAQAESVLVTDENSIVLNKNWELRPMITLGAAVLFEKTNDQRFQNSVLPLLIGVGLKLDQDFSRWTTRIEYSADESLDGNQTLSVRRRRQAALAWATRDLGMAKGWVSYLGLGAGFVQSEIVTTLNGASETGVGGWKGAFAGALGFRADWSNVVTIRAEFRYESAETLKTNDARSGVAVYLENSF
jgi:opacity protein-like surface antigen